MTSFNLQPDPRILIAITHNPMRPIDALCELIDNSLDSFREAEMRGHAVESPVITLSLPRPVDVERHGGSITILDNGPGLSLDATENALKAGFTSNRNRSDTLGLFGMGFNISTGKFGRRTLFRTAEQNAKQMIEVSIDLEGMVNSRSYDVPVEIKNLEPTNFHGTMVRISDWWTAGSPNFEFPLKLVRMGMPNILEELGRRYYPILREGKIRLFVNDTRCDPYVHCAWSDQRSVKHRSLGVIPAVYRFTETLNYQTTCSECDVLVESDGCPSCGKTEFLKTVEEKISGWLGIQRFDDANHYGIDIIRNGRVIRKSEKEALFTWTNASGNQIKDYPIDSIYGRIVGEVHINEVPTDFLKQDFQRTSPEWIRAIAFLRGESSLQPQIASDAGEPANDSPLYKLFQGYRRVRDVGSRDMYMGFWQSGEDKPRRISRNVESEYYEKFKNKEPGYFDDSEWWKLVEEADTKPVVDVQQCPDCNFQCLESAETCPNCDYIFIGKKCIDTDCGQTIAQSAVTCAHCGASQIIQPQDRWSCSYCNRMNPPTSNICLGCGRALGDINPLNEAYLLEHANKDDELSLPAFSVPLPGGVAATSFDVDVYSVDSSVSLEREGTALPSITFKGEGLKVFIDRKHPLFVEYQQHAEMIISMEIAKYLQDANARYMSGEIAHLWSLPTMCWQIARAYWQARLSIDPEQTRDRVEEFFNHLRETMTDLLHDRGEEIYASMPPPQQGQLIQRLVQNGFDARELLELVKSCRFLEFIDNRFTADLIAKYPERFFDGNLWTEAYEDIPLIEDPEQVDQIRVFSLNRYRNFLEDLLNFLEFKQKDSGYTVRAEGSLKLLTVHRVR
jgi:hypothetical protein